jgi:hypothetical protein
MVITIQNRIEVNNNSEPSINISSKVYKKTLIYK